MVVIVMEELKDWLGTPITVGCTIIYPGRQSGSLWMNKATVKVIGERSGPSGTIPTLTVVRTHSTSYGDPPDGSTTILTVIDRVTVMPS
jgi:hypothetical protein